MNRKLFVALVVLGLGSFVFTSCAKYPQAEVDATNLAVQEAVAAGAEMYLHDEFVAMQDSLKATMVSLEEEKSKFFKNFDAQIAQLATISQVATDLKAKTEVRKEELKVEIQTLITEIQALVDTNKVLVQTAPKGKEGKSALEAIKGEIEVIEASLAEVNTMFAGGELLATLDKAKAAKEKATAINVELNTVIEKFASAKRR